MNNKRGGLGAKLILILVLMLASAVAGGWAYSIIDGKFASKDAVKEINMVDTDDYDAAEAEEIDKLITEAENKLATVKTRKAVYEILIDFKKDVNKVKTAAEKKSEEQQNNYQYNNNNTTDNSNATGYDENPSGNYDFIFPSKENE
ncbi:MAG: hypothetical protein KBS56_04965 [Clostridiales bacterium]|nr:hypothetical protein [Candidatus Crickella equi]